MSGQKWTISSGLVGTLTPSSLTRCPRAAVELALAITPTLDAAINNTSINSYMLSGNPEPARYYPKSESFIPKSENICSIMDTPLNDLFHPKKKVLL